MQQFFKASHRGLLPISINTRPSTTVDIQSAKLIPVNQIGRADRYQRRETNQ